MRQLRILVVDDDLSVLDAIAAFLEGRGHAVTTAESVRDGIERLNREPFDLVISDIDTAHGNGFELLRTARRRCPASGIVLMTAYDERFSMSEALEAGADGYISKPFTLNKFSLILERAFWAAVERRDWWERHGDGEPAAKP